MMHENARLKKLVAERDLEIEVMKEINAKNDRHTAEGPSCSLCPKAWNWTAASMPVDEHLAQHDVL